MPYSITRSDGSTQQIQNEIVDNSKYSIGVVGKSTRGYGQPIAEATINRLENFANGTSPIQPIPGQLWFDTSTGYMRYNTGNSDHENIWTKIVSADSANNIGSFSDPYNTLYSFIIDADTIYANNVGSQTTPISLFYGDTIGTTTNTIDTIYATNISNVAAVGLFSDPVNNIYVDQLGSGASRINTIYANTIDSLSTNASNLGGELPSYYLDYNNFTNIPNYTSQFVDVSGDTMTGNLIMSGGASILLNHDPVLDLEAATKQYADNLLISGKDYKDSCRAATTTNITLSGTQTIDGVSLLVGDRVLVKNQSTASQNGIYDVAAGAWTRSTDADGSPSSEVTNGMFTFVIEGSINANTGWILSTPDPIFIDFTLLTFSQTVASAVYVAGTGINLSTSTFSANFGTSAGTISEGNHTHTNATVSVDGFMSATDKTKLDGIASGAEVNQNAFANIVVSGQNTLVADSKTDTLTLVEGSGINITTNSASDSITITNTSPNTNQNIVAGIGLSGGGSGDSVTITNADRGSSQNIFKNFVTDSGTVTASSNNDTLNLIGINGIATGISPFAQQGFYVSSFPHNGGGILYDNGPTGSIQFPNGFVIQWGETPIFADDSNVSFNFFPVFTTLYSITGVPNSSTPASNPGRTRIMDFFNMTNSGGQVHCNEIDGGGSFTSVAWVATGIV